MITEVRIYNGEKAVSSIVILENWTAACKKMKPEHSLTPCTKINSKRIIELHIRLNTIKLLKEKIRKTLLDINYSRIFFVPCL